MYDHYYLVDGKHGSAIVAGNTWDGKLYNQPPVECGTTGDRTNAMWLLIPDLTDGNSYTIRDVKHGKYIVAGDVYDGHLYHQDNPDRPNAHWVLAWDQKGGLGRPTAIFTDKKWNKSIVAGDTYDGHLYHQDVNDRPNARWALIALAV